MYRVRRRIADLARFLHIDPSVFGSFGMEQRTVSSVAETDGTAETIPVLHRLAIIYLMLPVLILLVGWFEWWFGVPFAVLVALGLWQALGPARASLNWQSFSGTMRAALRPMTVGLLLIAFGWVMTTAAGGVFDVSNGDWIKHRALFLDLARGSWPVYQPYWLSELLVFFPEGVEISGLLLRYYLGYYMVPGLLGKWFGVAALNWAVPIWTWCGIALMALLFTRGLSAWKAVAAVAILIFFSGMDIVTLTIFEGLEWFEPSFAWSGWPRISLGPADIGHVDYWEFLDVRYSSHMIGLMWVPQHFIAGGLYVLLLVQLRRQRRFLAVSGVVVGASIFWSPFVAVSLLPMVVVLLKENGIRPFLRWQNLLLSLPLVVLLITYLSSGTKDMRRNWLLENTALEYVMGSLPATYLLEFLILAILLVLLRPRLLREPFFIACLVTLLLLPWYSYGRNNDLVLRVSIPPLFLLSHFSARGLLEQRPEAERRRWSPYRVLLSAVIVTVLGIGAVGGVFNLINANNNHDLNVFRYSQFGPRYTIARTVPRQLVPQYLTSQFPEWYRSLLRDPALTEATAKRELIIRSAFDVYLLEGGIVAFVRSPCTQQDVDARFILHVFPSLDPGKIQDTLDFYFVQGPGFRIGEMCVTSQALPLHETGRIRAGQLNLDRTGPSWIANYYSEEYRDRLLAEAGEPIIRSTFDVYVNENKLMYNKSRCNEDDVVTPFRVQVTPVDVRDLSGDRKEDGLEYIYFTFSEYGGWIGEGCFLVHDLPDYAVLKISTGQYLLGGGQLWEGAATLGE